MALIDDEAALEPPHVDLVGADQEDRLDGTAGGALEDPLDVAAARAGQQAEVEAGRPGRRPGAER